MNLKLCLCCISIILKNTENKSFQTITWKRFSSLNRNEALNVLSDRIINNFNVTKDIIYFCKKNKFAGYRFSSSLVPLINHPEFKYNFYDLPKIDRILKSINEIKVAIKETNLKFSAHPGEYTTLTSENENSVSNSIRDLEFQAFLFDLFDLNKNYSVPINIHCRQDGDPEKISFKFLKNFERLSDSVKNRLVLEVNDNKNGTWSVKNLYKYFYSIAKIPVTFDVLHHKFCHGDLSEEDAFHLAYSTWNVIPLFHYSEGIDNKRSHADYALNKPNSYGKDVYWEVELKAKDLAIIKILNEGIM